MPQTTRKALGKGLEQLFSSQQIDFTSLEREIVESTPKNEIVEIPLDEIRSNPYQPRVHFNEEALKELASSIEEHGVLEPIIVKKGIKGYELVAGERRTKASLLAGKKTIPAIIKDFDDRAMMEVALLENIQREDLSAIEEAKAIRNIMQKLDMTQEEVAKRFGKSRSYITNLLGLLTLPKSVQDDVVDGKISMSHARVLSKYNDPDKIIELAKKIKDDGISVRELEGMSQTIEKKKPTKPVLPSVKSTRHRIYEEAMRDLVGSKVLISSNKITIPYATDADLDRIMEILNIEIGE